MDQDLIAEQARRLRNDPKVREGMELRCEEEGHDFENCCSALFQVYQQCRWCGATR